LLREARLVKDLLPLHNYRLRRKLNACFIRIPDLRSAPDILQSKDIDWNSREAGAETLFGPFATKQHVKQLLEQIAGEQGLCWRQLGWEKRGGPCFARQVKKCRGACLGEETPEQHNLRLATALTGHRVLEWPWPGRVVIRERHPEGRIEEAHVFERWSHLGTARSEEELADLAEARAEIDFDPDIYRILQSFIARHRHAVTLLPRMTPDYSEFEAA
jgi:DNA polymerase-3 subunit epsilon